MIRELETVVLVGDVPEHRLRMGDVGTVVHAYADGSACEVEFITAGGRTVALLTLERDAIRPMAAQEILHVRKVGAA